MRSFSSFLFILTVCISTFITSCKGPEGPVGATGAKGDAGTSGPTGAKGDKGDTGSANVKYTEWFAPEWDDFFRSEDNLYMLLNTTKTSQAILTEEVIDKSAIHIYIRYNERIYNNANGGFELIQRVTGNSSIWGYTKVPDRITNTQNDFNQILAAYDNVGKNYFKPRIQINTNFYDLGIQREIAIEEYKTKTAIQIRELSKDIAQFRIVVIPGAVLSGRQKAVNFDNYEEVKNVFGLTD